MEKNCPLVRQQCGGCPLLETDYAAQLAEKRARVRTLCGKFAPIEPVRGMKHPWHYRNKAIFTFAMQEKKLVSGIYAAGSHRVLPAESCLLQDETINAVLAAVQAAAVKCRYEAFEEDRGTGLLRHVLVRRGFSTGEVMVVLVTAEALLPGAKNFVKYLLAEAAARQVPVTTVVQNLNPRKTSAVLGTQNKTLYGHGYILDSLCGHTFAIGPRSFYQVNPVQTETLYALAVKAAALTGSETVIDAYCGIGTIGLTAAPHAKSVVGIEVNPDAVRDAAGNARHSGIRNARFYAADATAWLASAAEAGEKADVVFMDPPREGSTPQFLHAVTKLSPARLIYVSCNPETLARDLAVLQRDGWRAVRIWPVDMFPHTEHIECVCSLVRAGKK